MQRTTLSVTLLLLLLSGGCVVAAAAVVGAAVYGIIQYENNEAVRHYEAAYAKTYNAVLKAMREEGYPVQEGLEPHPSGETKIEINDAHARVKMEADQSTVVAIRIGTFETAQHKGMAERILNRVAQDLGVK